MTGISNYLQELHTKDSIEKELTHFFPSVGNDLFSEIQMILFITTPRLPEAEETLKKYLKNLDIKTRLNYSTSINAFTIPHVSSILTVQSLIIPIVGNILQILYATNQLESSKLLVNAKKYNNKIIFPKSDIVFQYWITKGAYSYLTEREFIAMSLHELGHWTHPQITINKSILFWIRNIPLLTIICFLLKIMITRSSEIIADNYVKQLGFEKELVSMFDKMYIIRKNVSFYIKINDFINVLFVKFHDMIDDIIPLLSHPSNKKRKLLLMTDTTISENYYLQEFNLDKIKSIIDKRILSITLPIDKLLHENLDKFFPVKG